MGIVQRLLSFSRMGQERRSSPMDAHLWPSLLANAKSKSGQYVSPDTALQVTAVYACVRIIAETVASLPFVLYRKRRSGSRDVADSHYLYRLIHESPNVEQTSFELIEMLCGHLCLRGNSYSYLEGTGAGGIEQIWPLNPSQMIVERLPDGRRAYRYTDPLGRKREYSEEQIWHIRGLSSDGLMGLSPVSLAREAIGLSMASEDYQSRFFTNYARPGGVLSTPGKLSPEAKTHLKTSWETAFTGENAHRVAVLEGGLSWNQIGMSNSDAQFLELRNFSIEEICRIFRVPAILLEHPTKTATFASAEQQMLAFVQHTVRPWLERLEQSANRSLLSQRERNTGYYCEFKIEGLLRGDMQSRYQAYAVGRQWGWLSVNDIRELENMNDIGPEGDEYLRPMNMTPLGEEEPEEEQPAPVNGGNGNGGEEDAITDADEE